MMIFGVGEGRKGWREEVKYEEGEVEPRSHEGHEAGTLERGVVGLIEWFFEGTDPDKCSMGERQWGWWV